MEFTPIETQEALDALLSERETAVRGEYADYDELKAQVETQKTTILGYERAELRCRIAAETGVPAALAQRISGEDEEAMRADAKALLESLPKESRRKAPPLRNPEPPVSDSPWRDMLAGLKR